MCWSGATRCALAGERETGENLPEESLTLDTRVIIARTHEDIGDDHLYHSMCASVPAVFSYGRGRERTHGASSRSVRGFTGSQADGGWCAVPRRGWRGAAGQPG